LRRGLAVTEQNRQFKRILVVLEIIGQQIDRRAGVVLEIHVVDVVHAAVVEADRAALQDGMPIIRLGHIHIGRVDGGDADLRERLHLNFLFP